MMKCIWGLPLQPNKSMIGNACKTVSASVTTCSNSSNKAMIGCSRHRLYLLNSWYIKGRGGKGDGGDDDDEHMTIFS